jgi:hypothetical protein
MKKIAALFLLCSFTSALRSQNVAINATGAAANTSAMLDVSATNKGVSFPNVSLVSETDAATIPTPMKGLMVFNTNTAMPCGSGLYYNNGTPGAPVWTCFTKTIKNLHAFDISGRAGVNTTANTLQPGCSITFVIPTGQTADVKIDAFLGALASLGGTSAGFDAVIYFDGAFLPKGGWSRLILNANTFGVATLSTFVANVAAGSHTIELRSSRSSNNGACTLSIGGDCSLATNCGEINAQIFYK